MGPEEKLLWRLERYTVVETLPDYFPDIKYEFSKLRDAEGDKKAIRI